MRRWRGRREHPSPHHGRELLRAPDVAEALEHRDRIGYQRYAIRVSRLRRTRQHAVRTGWRYVRGALSMRRPGDRGVRHNVIVPQPQRVDHWRVDSGSRGRCKSFGNQYFQRSLRFHPSEGPFPATGQPRRRRVTQRRARWRIRRRSTDAVARSLVPSPHRHSVGVFTIRSRRSPGSRPSVRPSRRAPSRRPVASRAAPSIDGALDERVWQDAVPLTRFRPGRAVRRTAGLRTHRGPDPLRRRGDLRGRRAARPRSVADRHDRHPARRRAGRDRTRSR